MNKGMINLEFVYGRSGFGKSTKMFADMIQASLAHPEKNYVVLVPEQATLSVQKTLLAMHPAHVLMNIDILSFQRMAYKVVEELHITLPPILNETGKMMILRKAVGESRESLEVFGKNLDRPGFTNELKSLVSEMCQYEIPVDTLEDLAKQQGVTPLLQRKMKDLSLICHAFKNQMENHYMMAEELLEVLAKELYRSKWASDTEVYLDGFTGFTPLQYRVLDELMKYSLGLHLEVTMPKEEWKKPHKEHDLFYMSYEMKEKLEKLAEKNLLQFQAVSAGDQSYRVKAKGPLSYLERSYGKPAFSPYQGENGEIRVVACKNPEQEAEFVTAEIGKLLREKKYRMKEIGVVSGDLERYASAISKSFAKADFSYFIDEKKNMAGNACMEAIRSALEVVKQNYSYESMFHFLRCGISGLEGDLINRMENYVLAMGIRGKKGWGRDWTKTSREFPEESLVLLNAGRKVIGDIFLPFGENLKKKDATVTEQLNALRQFLTAFHLETYLEQMAQELTLSGDVDLAKEYSQLYGKLEEFLAQFEGLMGEEVLSLEDFSAVLDSGFGEMKVGLVPSTLDRILVGDLKRTRLPEIQVLFVLGVNDGIIPQAADKGGILSELDREILKKCQVELSPDSRQEMFTQRYYLYRIMTKPKGELVLSYSNTDADGKGIRKSELISQLQGMFPMLEVEHFGGKDGRFASEAEGLAALAEGLCRVASGEKLPWVKPLFHWFCSQDPKMVEKMLSAAERKYVPEQLEAAEAFRVYGEKAVDSVTRLEQFAACPYAHFLNYGLGLRERREYELKPTDFGSLYHRLLEVFQEILAEEELDFLALSEEKRREIAKKSLEIAAKEYGNNIYESSFKNQYLLRLLEQSAGRNLTAISKQLAKGKYRIWGTEVPFAVNQELSFGEALRLRGRIDRVDAASTEEGTFVRVLDYKTGQKEFDLSRFYYGLQLQLPIYLGSALNMVGKREVGAIRPGGFYYYRIQDPLVEGEGVEAAEQLMMDALRLSGVTNSGAASMNLLDLSLGQKSGIIRNLAMKKDGGLAATSDAVSERVLENICHYAEEKSKELAEEIYGGNIRVTPYEYGTESSCDFCPYVSVCGFDRDVEGFSYRRLRKLDTDTIGRMMEKGGQGEDAVDDGTAESH